MRAARRHRSSWPVVVDTALAAAGSVVVLYTILYFGPTVLARELRAEDRRYGMIGIVEARGPDVVPRQGPLLVFNSKAVLYNGLAIEDAGELAEQLEARWELRLHRGASEGGEQAQFQERAEELRREQEQRRVFAQELRPEQRGRFLLGDPRHEILLAAYPRLPTATLRPYLRAIREAGYRTVHLVFRDQPSNPFEGGGDYTGARVLLVEEEPPERRALGVQVAGHRTFAELAREAIRFRRRGEEVRLDL